MAQLFFRYGAMGSSKTANALMTRFNYIERGKSVLMLKSSIDTRDEDRTVKSRIGLSAPCMYFENFAKCYTMMDLRSLFDVIIVDEAQFLGYDDVKILSDIVDNYEIPVLCYGLRTDFKGKLFEGSAALFAMADKIEEIKTICWCGKKATYNARFNEDGTVLKDGEQIDIGANEKYIGLCRKHWKEGRLHE